MKKNNQKTKEMNAYVEFINKGKYNNMYLTIYLPNGQEVKMQVKQAFYNSKLDYKLQQNLK